MVYAVALGAVGVLVLQPHVLADTSSHLLAVVDQV